ncbi:MAG: hypothetical protein AAGI69_10045 [Cyanobacteria bacterium P01_H01_bin.21]
MFHPSKSRFRLLWLFGIIGTATTSSYLLIAPVVGFTPSIFEKSSLFSWNRAKNLKPVEGWFEAGSHPSDYAMGADRRVIYNGIASGTIQSKNARSEGFGTLMQISDASGYQGQRLRLRGYVKAKAVDDWAGMWMRVDSASGQVLSFDNMEERAIRGTTDWQPYDIVLDVPVESNNIAFGLLLAGNGQVWMDNLQFEVVDDTTPTTNMTLEEPSRARQLTESPANLSFETF